MKKHLLTILIIFCAFYSKAQLTINDSLSTSHITTLLQGLGVTITSLTVNCPTGAIGEFNGVSEMPITHGLALSTGMVTSIADSNSISSTTTMFGYPGDSDLDSLSGSITHDGCVLEFDALPTGDTLYFNYSFGSEEYPEFVGSFNDVFAILINGPGITGRVNVATLPGGIPVSINNVNSVTNSAFYYDNETPPGHYISFDGFTTNLTAFAQVIPDSTYHFKVAIADAGDEAYDSGVMLEAFSFRCVAAEPPSTSGIHENNISSLAIYPNPSTGDYYINDKENVLQGSEIKVINVLGQEVFSEKISSSKMHINISNQPTGIYYVSVMTEKSIYKAKIFKK